MDTLALKEDIKDKAVKIFDLLDIKDETRAEYKNRIGLLFDFIKDNKLTYTTFADYKRYLDKRADYTIATKNKYLATARIFLKELYKLGYLPVDITQNIKNFRQDKKHKRLGLNDMEIKRLFEYLKELPLTYEAIRLKSIIALLLYQGLRQVEVIRLNVEDLNLNEGLAYIQGKGKDDKEPVYLHPETIKILRQYLHITNKKTGALFTCNSNRARGQRITTRALRGIVKDTLSKLEIQKTTHGFRHYFTTKLLEIFKGNITLVANFTRHKSLEMIKIYNDKLNYEAELPQYYEGFNYAI